MRNLAALVSLLLLNLIAITFASSDKWQCPKINSTTASSSSIPTKCSCDFPHTLRCTGGEDSLQIVLSSLVTQIRNSRASVSLLDCTLQNVTSLGPLSLDDEDIGLHGLVVSSGEIKTVHGDTFISLADQLQALGLPNNQLDEVPLYALRPLRGLNRLDLSHNKLTRLSEFDFMNLKKLTYLELSDNLISEITENVFRDLNLLTILWLRKNRLSRKYLVNLKYLHNLKELDLCLNNLTGPLEESFLPILENMNVLHLNKNRFTSVRQNALKGVASLTTLSLRYNEIDVLEDKAFASLPMLKELDLGYNGIVAISNNSLYGLTKLQRLDLAHNFLRALTSDLVSPLPSLTKLFLEDNDISIVKNNSLLNRNLRSFSLGNNPLSCDCSLVAFSIWLRNAPFLSADDKNSPVCGTPPNLEGGILLEIPVKDLKCHEDVGEVPVPRRVAPSIVGLPISSDEITLKYFSYEEPFGVVLTWTIEDKKLPYSCDAIFIYEETSAVETLLDANPVHCESSALENPQELKINVPGSRDLQSNHQYRYCLVLIQSSLTDDEEFVLGCSDVITLNKQNNYSEEDATDLNIVNVAAAVTEDGELSVKVEAVGESHNSCLLGVGVFAQGSLIAKGDFQCGSVLKMQGFLNGPYTVCVASNKHKIPGPFAKCTPVILKLLNEKHIETIENLNISNNFSTDGIAMSPIVPSIALAVILIAVVIISWKAIFARKHQNTTHQCYVSTINNQPTVNPRYVKLEATTTL